MGKPGDRVTPGPSALEPHTRRDRLREELFRYLGISAYLYVCFLALELYKAAALQAVGLHYVVLGLAAGKALVIGKFALIGDAVGAGQRVSSRNVLQRIINRSLLLFVALLLLKCVEEAILGAVRGRSVASMVSELVSGALPELLASSFLLLLILVPWVFVTELDRVLGKGSIKSLLMRRLEAGGHARK